MLLCASCLPHIEIQSMDRGHIRICFCAQSRRSVIKRINLPAFKHKHLYLDCRELSGSRLARTAFSDFDL
jgi:hypothetical protein